MGFGGFSFKRASGLSAQKAKLSRSIGVPISKSGRDQKLGRMVRKAGFGFFAFTPESAATARRPGLSIGGLAAAGLFTVAIIIVITIFYSRWTKPAAPAFAPLPAIDDDGRAYNPAPGEIEHSENARAADKAFYDSMKSEWKEK